VEPVALSAADEADEAGTSEVCGKDEVSFALKGRKRDAEREERTVEVTGVEVGVAKVEVAVA